MAVRAWKARALFAGPDGRTEAAANPELAAEADAWGIPRELVANQELRAERSGLDDYEGLFPDHVLPMKAFLAADTQWRYVHAGMTILATGIDYGAAKTAWDALGITLTPVQFACFRKIENEALVLLNGGQA